MELNKQNAGKDKSFCEKKLYLCTINVSPIGTPPLQKMESGAAWSAYKNREFFQKHYNTKCAHWLTLALFFALTPDFICGKAPLHHHDAAGLRCL